MDILVFPLADRRCGLPVADVLEVLRAVSILPLPGVPAPVEGIVDLRGTVVPVLDLRPRLGLPPKPLEPEDYLIVGRAFGRTVALRVDGLPELLRLSPEDVDDLRRIVPESTASPAAAKLPDGVVLIHELGAFLSQAEVDALEASPALSLRGAP